MINPTYPTKSPTLVNSFIGLIDSDNNFRPNIFVGLNLTRISGNIESGNMNSKVFSYKPALVQSDYCEDGIKFECVKKEAVNKFAYARLIEFLSSDGAEMLRNNRIGG